MDAQLVKVLNINIHNGLELHYEQSKLGEYITLWQDGRKVLTMTYKEYLECYNLIYNLTHK